MHETQLVRVVTKPELSMNYKDFTLKAKIKDIEHIEKLLTRMNSRYIGLDNQTDYYFETPTGKLKLRQGTIENLITHYERVTLHNMEKTIVYRYDKDPTLDQVNQLRLSHKQQETVQKQRKIYTLGHVKIHLDRLPDGRCFLEIEAIDRTNQYTDDELRDQCLTLKSTLGIPDSDLVQTGYFKE